jgi:methylamine dehydrogenase accessory protein MauD
MSGIWLITYIALWGIVLFQGLVIFVLMRQLGIIYLGTAQGVARDGIAPGQRAPDFALPDLSGGIRTLADFQGRSLLLVFGSTSCAPCRGLVPDLNVFAKQHAGDIDALFAIRGTANEAQRFVDELELQVPVGVFNDEELPEKYKARVTPFAFLIDGEGVVRAKGLSNNMSHLDMLLKAAEDGSKGRRGTNGRIVLDPSLAEKAER